MIQLEGVTRGYRDGARGLVPVLSGVTLRVEAGDFVAVVGRSGSGKSTLLQVVGGLDTGYQGTVTVDGQRLEALDDAGRARFRNRTVGFVFQAFHLVSGLSAQENVALPAHFGERMAPAQAQVRAREALAQVGLEGKAEKAPSQLSGGERQRVAIARALFNRPRLLLCDEPTGNLDAGTASEVVALFQRLNREGLTVLAVTHEDTLRTAARRVLTLESGVLR